MAGAVCGWNARKRPSAGLTDRQGQKDGWAMMQQFDEPKVTGWVSGYHRILSRLVSEPDREWRQLAVVAS
jgi:hypothetical protein